MLTLATSSANLQGRRKMAESLPERLRYCADHVVFAPHMHHVAADRIEQLEKALHDISAMNALRDRWSDPIENVILAALEGK